METAEDFTNPLSAADNDHDGIAEDFEKHLAKQLLEFQPDPLVWGIFYAGIMTGDLDANHDYTGEGRTLSEYALLRLEPWSSTTAETESRMTATLYGETGILQTTSGGVTETRAVGSFAHGWYNGAPSTDMTTTLVPNAAWYISKTELLPWDARYMTAFNPNSPSSSIRLSHDIQITTDRNTTKTLYPGRYEQKRIRIWGPKIANDPVTYHYLIITQRTNKSFDAYPSTTISTVPVKLEIKKGQSSSDWLEIKPTLVSNQDHSYVVSLLPVEVAPEVLAVNSDFDEGRIDPATGYAIPDCDDIPGVDQKTGSGNTQIALNASRAHLDSLFANDEKVTDDMHKGWFGLNPNQLGDDFWNGANVTIRKIDKIDDETGYKESGQVRFYAKWSGGYYGISPYDFQTLQPVNLVSAGVNLRPNEGVYGSTSTIPDGAEFYMEGVRPGKITLEWRLQKGTIDVKHEQTFKVETRKTLAEWREEVRYQIRLQTKVKTGSEVDVAAYHTGNGFRNTSGSQPVDSDNVARVQAIYYYYQQLFKQMPEKFMWAGMAKTAAAPIYAGMSDMSSWLWATDPIPPDDDRDPGVDIFVKLLLLGGQKAIYEDKAWAHRAYLASGKWALDWVDRNSIGSKPTSFDAWSDLDVGIQDSDQDLINQANHDLLQREQRDVIQTYYASYATPYFMKQPPSGFSFFGRWIEIVGAVHLTPNANGLVNTGEWLSANANKNPMPGGPKFRDIVPGGRIDNYQDRWNWTANTANGMLSIWTGEATDTSVPKFNAGQRLSESNKTMYSAAAAYSYDTGGLPIE